MPQIPGPAAVSVITPTRLVDNRIGYLAALHASLHTQTLPWHWLLAIDGADPAKIPTAISTDPRVEILDLPRWVGAATARNLALGRARTEYVAFVDDDDLLPPASLSVRYAHAEAHALGWVAGLTMDLHPSGELRPAPGPRIGPYRPGDVWSSWTSPDASRPPIGHTTMLTRRDAALAAGGQGGLTQGEDYIYVLQVTGRYPGAVLPNVTNFIRSHPEQMTRQAGYDVLERAVRHYSWSIGQALAAHSPFGGRQQAALSAGALDTQISFPTIGTARQSAHDDAQSVASASSRAVSA